MAWLKKHLVQPVMVMVVEMAVVGVHLQILYLMQNVVGLCQIAGLLDKMTLIAPTLDCAVLTDVQTRVSMDPHQRVIRHNF